MSVDDHSDQSDDEPFDPPLPVVVTDLVRVTSRNTGYDSDSSSSAADSESQYDENGRTMINQYHIGREIGKGRHGVVKVCHANGQNRKLAMKIVNRDPPQAQKQRKLKQNRPDYVAVVDKIHTIETKIRREIAIMKKCRHPHVVRLLEVIDDRQKSSIYMVMEFLGGGEISWKDNDEKPILSVDQSRRIIRDAILGLEYLHYYGIIHRDIKPANLVWTKNREHVKIADFGVAHSSYAQRLSAGLTDDDEDVPLLMNDSELAQRAGTPPFLAPEVVYEYTERSDGLPRPHITKSIDIWALGVTLYCFLFGHLPFKPPPDAEGNSISFEAATYRMICNYDWIAPPMMGYDEIPTGGRHPEDALSLGGIVIELLDHCLEKDMAMRITLQEIKGSAWFISDLPNPDIWLRDTTPQPIHVSPAETSAAMSSVRWRWAGVLWSLYNSVRTSRSQRVLDRPPMVNLNDPAWNPSQDSAKRKGKKPAKSRVRSKSSDPFGTRSTPSPVAHRQPRQNGHGLWEKVLRRKSTFEPELQSQPQAAAASDISFWRGRRSIEVLSPHKQMRAPSDLSGLERRTSSYHDRPENLEPVSYTRTSTRSGSRVGSIDERYDTDSSDHLSFSPKKRR